MSNLLNQIVEESNNSFIEKLGIMFHLMKVDLSNYNFEEEDNNSEIKFNDFSLNIKYKFAGKYFNKVGTSLTIWLGYYAEYGFCISFWIEERHLRNSILNAIEDLGYNCLCSYSGAKQKNSEEKYWLNIKLKTTTYNDILIYQSEAYKKAIQDEVDKIMTAIMKEIDKWKN